jgi:hypothetical protein
MNKPTLAVLATVLTLAGCGRAQTRDDGAADSVVTVDSGTAPDTGIAGRTPPVTNAPKTIEAVLAAHADSLMAVPGVVGTAVGRCRGAPCIRVLVTRTSDELRQRIPRELGGFPVQIDVTGPIVPR